MMLLLSSNYNISSLTASMLLFSILTCLFLYIFRKCSYKEVLNIIRILSIFLICIYFIKTFKSEIVYINSYHKFYLNILPFDACSIIMYSSLIAAFAKGKLKEYADSWIVIGGLSCGVATLIYKYYFSFLPFASNPSLYTIVWHFIMIFLALLLLMDEYIKLKWNIVLKAFLFHFVISLFVIPIDFIFKLDFMFYRELSQIPVFFHLGKFLTSHGLQFLNPLIMLLLYFLLFNVAYVVCIIFKKFCDLLREEKKDESKSNR